MNTQVSLPPQPAAPIVVVEHAAIRLADEGIPVRAIARSLKTPSDEIYEILHDAIATGLLLEMPKDDWPVGSSRANRISFNGSPLEDEEAFMFACARAFKVTKLEVAVLTILLKRAQATKEQLHHAIKQSRPGAEREEIDPKIVDVVICHLRKKLKDQQVQIQTVWGIGYLISLTDRERAVALLNNALQQENTGG
jgi:DNA-binding response OmpR family regulator